MMLQDSFVTNASMRLLHQAISIHTKDLYIKVLDTFVTNASIWLFCLVQSKYIKNPNMRVCIIYTCDQCEYAATQPFNLKKRKEYKHKIDMVYANLTIHTFYICIHYLILCIYCIK